MGCLWVDLVERELFVGFSVYLALCVVCHLAPLWRSVTYKPITSQLGVICPYLGPGPLEPTSTSPTATDRTPDVSRRRGGPERGVGPNRHLGVDHCHLPHLYHPSPSRVWREKRKIIRPKTGLEKICSARKLYYDHAIIIFLRMNILRPYLKKVRKSPLRLIHEQKVPLKRLSGPFVVWVGPD